MLKSMLKNIMKSLIYLIMLSLPIYASAQTETTNRPGAPPISQQLIREGDFAVKLQVALGIGTSDDEVEAETALGDLGITPKNGWIADYPVTPDILGELRSSLIASANDGKIDLNSEEALKRLESVSAEMNLGVKPHSTTVSHQTSPEEAVKYPNPTVINNYYTTEGPPVVTYYTPPPDYYYLYGWVPYPFWWAGFWFPGYFILNDFHRPHYYGHRAVFISNHFNHISAHRVFRIDPVQRYSGRTYAGIGVINRRAFIPTGISRSEQRVFNSTRSRRVDSGSNAVPAMRKDPVSTNRTKATKTKRREDGGARSNTQPLRIERESTGSGGGGRSSSGGGGRSGSGGGGGGRR